MLRAVCGVCVVCVWCVCGGGEEVRGTSMLLVYTRIVISDL